MSDFKELKQGLMQYMSYPSLMSLLQTTQAALWKILPCLNESFFGRSGYNVDHKDVQYVSIMHIVIIRDNCLESKFTSCKKMSKYTN